MAIPGECSRQNRPDLASAPWDHDFHGFEAMIGVSIAGS
jgi:hypothetical protein